MQLDLVPYDPRNTKSSMTRDVTHIHSTFIHVGRQQRGGVRPEQLPQLLPLPVELTASNWKSLGKSRTSSSMGKSLQGKVF